MKSLFAAETTPKPSGFGSPILEVNAGQIIDISGGNLSPRAAEIVKQNNIATLSDQQVVLFGSGPQRKVSDAFNQILPEISKGSDSVIYTLFDRLKKGVEQTDVAALETEIRDSQKGNFLTSLLDSMKLSSMAKRLEKQNQKIGEMLTSKSKSLLDLTNEMETKINEETSKLLNGVTILDRLSKAFRDSIDEIGVHVEAGREILALSKEVEVQKNQLAAASNDTLQIEDAKAYSQRVQLFESRLLNLETVFRQAPVELESIRLGKGATLSTLANVSNDFLSDMNSIKSVLIRLSVSHRTMAVQGINAQRKQLLEGMQNHGNAVLEQVAVESARQIGQAKLDDANRLLQFATSVNNTAKKIQEEERQNQIRFAETRNKLEEVKKLITI